MADIQHEDFLKFRSEKTRKVLREIPQFILKLNIILITGIIILILAITTCMDYPYGDGESILEHIIESI